MTQQATTATAKGLDLGTSRIVVARPEHDAYRYHEHLNAFISVPFSAVAESTLARVGVEHLVRGGEILVYGNRVDEFASILNTGTRRPMRGGILNPSEPKNIEMISLALERMCGRAAEGEKICFSVPGPPPGNEDTLIFHERTVTQILENLGYRVMSLNEGLAVVYAELEGSNYTGIGVSFGAGMCNVCLAYLGLPVLKFCTLRAGDFIDRSASSVTGEAVTTIRRYKEQAFHLNGFSLESVDQALSVYYGDMIQSAVAGLEKALSETKKLPKIERPLPLVLSGGSAKAGGFQAEMEKAVRKATFPFEVAEVRLAADPLNTTAKGALMAALLER